MTSSGADGSSTHMSEHDQMLAAVLAKLADRQAAGETIDIRAVARAHPEVADELQELWGAVMLADAVGTHTSGASGATPGDLQFDSDATIELPCRFGDYELLSELERPRARLVEEGEAVAPGGGGDDVEVAVAVEVPGSRVEAADDRPREPRGAGVEAASLAEEDGHGLGLEVHELPAVKEGDLKLKKNMVITIEPGIYIPDRGGIRIEDMVLVTSKGNEVLTKSSKDVIIL